MRPKLIAFDLDGTLLDDEKGLPEENLSAMLAAVRAGVLLVPATGRIPKGLPEFLMAPGLFRYGIFSNGAEVLDLKEGKTLYQACIGPEQAVEICEYMDGLPVLYDCYRDGWGYMTQTMFDAAPSLLETEPQILRLLQRLRTPVPDLKEDILAVGRPLQKLQMYFGQESLRERDRQLRLLPDRFPSLAVSSSVRINIELNSRDARKGKALRALCEALGISTEDCVAFGDGLNDVDLLRTAGRGCAMENASPEVRAAADAVVGSNNAAGVGKEIFRLLES